LASRPRADLLQQRQIAHAVRRAHLEPALHLPLDETLGPREIGGEHGLPIGGVDAGEAIDHRQAELVDGLVGIGPAIRQAFGQRDALDPLGDGERLADHLRITAPGNRLRHGASPFSAEMTRYSRSIPAAALSESR
jgi:hypothetical protein